MIFERKPDICPLFWGILQMNNMQNKPLTFGTIYAILNLG